MNAANPKVDAYLGRIDKWQEETKKLRGILLDCPLTEEVKWGQPCYTFEGSNVVIIQGFIAYCAVLFFKGVLLKDPNDILHKTGENTRVGRQIRFNSVQEIDELEAVLKAYIHQAIEVEKSGLKVDSPEPKELELPEEFLAKLSEVSELQNAFDELTPGRQRAYSFYFSAPKQSKTREARIEKCVPQILAGKGLNDE